MYEIATSNISKWNRQGKLSTRVLLLAMIVILISCFGIGQTCTQSFSPSTVGTSGANVQTAVRGGNSSTVLCFSSGTYGAMTITSASPSGIVTLMPASGASVAMGTITLGGGVNNILITGFSGASSSNGLAIQGGNNTNITFSHNAMTTNGVMIRDNGVNANILIDSNTFIGFTALDETARLHIFNNGCPDMGVTVSNNEMAQGAADGIQWGGCGLKLLNNNIHDLTGNPGGIHQDGIQGVGDSYSVIRGNYIHNVANCWQLTDGTNNITMEDNVCVADGSDGHSGQLSSQGAIFNHNTIVSPYDINIGNDSNGKSSSNFTVTNNIFNGQFSVNSGQVITGTNVNDHNLCYSGTCTGIGSPTNKLVGVPTYTGGSQPNTYAGYALSSSSIGKSAGSDGKDVGIRTTTSTAGGPAAPTNLSVTVQ